MRFSLYIVFAAAAILCFAGFSFAAQQKGPIEGEALVVLKNGVGVISASTLERSAGDGYIRTIAGSAGARAVKTFDALSEESNRIFVHMKSDTLSTEALIASLKENPEVLFASPNYPRYATRVPGDPRYAEQWAPKRIGAETAWGLSTGKSDLYVAVVDTGVQRDHPDLQGNVDTRNSRNFTTSGSNNDRFDDGDGHGTHVSGIIGAIGDNAVGVAGLNWDVNIIALKMLNDEGVGTTAMELAAINFLVSILRNNSGMNLPAVNLSFGGWDDTTPLEALNTTLWQAYKTLDNLNRAVIVVAAGNEGAEVGAPAPFAIYDSNGNYTGSAGDYCYPASYIGLDNMIVVGSINQDDTGSEYSNWSSRYVHLAAPGGRITSTNIGSGYATYSGTSMATPHVSGSIALLASVYPDLTASELKSHVLRHANSATNPLAPAINSNRPVSPQNVTNTTLSRYGLINITNLLSTSIRSVEVRSITVRGVSSMTAGESRMFGVQIEPEEATDKRVTWESSNTDVATVASDGRVTARAGGIAIIRAVARDGSGEADTMTITVKTNIWEEIFGDGGGGCTTGAGAILLAAVTLLAGLRRKTK